jgi:hypothetical protein
MEKIVENRELQLLGIRTIEIKSKRHDDLVAELSLGTELNRDELFDLARRVESIFERRYGELYKLDREKEYILNR